MQTYFLINVEYSKVRRQHKYVAHHLEIFATHYQEIIETPSKLIAPLLDYKKLIRQSGIATYPREKVRFLKWKSSRKKSIKKIFKNKKMPKTINIMSKSIGKISR